MQKIFSRHTLIVDTQKKIFFFLVFVYFFFSNVSKSIAGDVVINEFQVEPSGSSQWVELFNKGNDPVDVSNWIISDSADHGFTIPSILLNSHQCISFTSSSYHFNIATSDGVRLKNGESIVDSHDYEKSPGNFVSLGRSPDGADSWVSFTSPTKDALNENGTSCFAPAATSTPTITPAPTKTSTPTNIPTPTKTPTPIKTPTPTKTPTPIKSGPTPGKSGPTSTKTPVPTTKSAATKHSSLSTITERDITALPNVTKVYPTAVLGASSSATAPTGISSTAVLGEQTKKSGANPLLFALPIIGVGLISGGAFYYLKKRRNGDI